MGCDQTCFVITPFGGNFDSYYKEIIAPTVKDAGLIPIRGDEIYGTRPIIEDIFDHIQAARVIVADVTERNPNVNYELGLAHAMKKPVIILTADMSDVPFDYRHHRVIIYDTKTVTWVDNLKSDIRNTCNKVLNDYAEFNSLYVNDNNKDEICKFLSRMQKAFNYIISKESIIDLDEKGNGKIHQKWTIEAKSDVTHVYHKIILDNPSNIYIDKVFDPLNGVNLDYVVEEAGATYLNYFILLNYSISSGTIGNIVVEFRVNGYLSELVNNSKANIYHQNMQSGRARFGAKKETYNFPNTKEFQGLYGVIKNHPNTSMIGEKIESKVEKNKRTIVLDLDASSQPDGNYSVELNI